MPMLMPMRFSNHNLPLYYTLLSHNSRISPDAVKAEKKILQPFSVPGPLLVESGSKGIFGA
jgi:hypothetical protein